MALTRYFKDTVRERLQADPEFRKELLKEAVRCLFNNEVNLAKSVIRDYINATVGFIELGELVGKSPKSLMRMFSEKGNPRANNLFEVLSHLKKDAGVDFKIS